MEKVGAKSRHHDVAAAMVQRTPRGPAVVLGDSNAVALCNVLDSAGYVTGGLAGNGWTIEHLLRKLKRCASAGDKSVLRKASKVVVFVGLNDWQMEGTHLAQSVLGILDVVCKLRGSTAVPVLVIPPFGVNGYDTGNVRLVSTIEHRRKACRALSDREGVGPDGVPAGVSVVTAHVTTGGSLTRRCTLVDRQRVDPLHLSQRGYETLASAVDRVAGR